jgi:ubiquinol-cytochrome c reductase cytochrome b subunit
MIKPSRKTHQPISILNSTLIDLPSPSNIPYWWNIGSLLGICLISQTITGILLAIHFTPNTESSFDTIRHIIRNVNNLWIIRLIHINGASLFFSLIYLHIARSLLFASFTNKNIWASGIILLLTLIATAFLGYVLPWGQISFWAATVITNLLSAIPYIGKITVQWIWGGFSVSNPTLTRFYTFHFILPFIIIIIATIHIIILHQTGSSNPLGLPPNTDKSSFHPFFSWKDLLGLLVISTLFIQLTLNFPFNLRDPDNFNPANPIITPPHIQPEWYFLFAYAILRSIPNKLGGVIALTLSILSLIIISTQTIKHKTLKLLPLKKTITWLLITSFLLLTWLGAQPVETPYEVISQIITILYFLLILINPITNKWLLN